MSRALIVLGHGSRSAEATAQFLQVTEILKAKSGEPLVYAAFMELAPPSLPEVAAQAIAAGATEIVVLPCFFFMGNHIKRDIPEILDALKAEYPAVTFHFAKPIGADPRIVDILLDRAEAL